MKAQVFVEVTATNTEMDANSFTGLQSTEPIRRRERTLLRTLLPRTLAQWDSIYESWFEIGLEIFNIFMSTCTHTYIYIFFGDIEKMRKFQEVFPSDCLRA